MASCNCQCNCRYTFKVTSTDVVILYLSVFGINMFSESASYLTDSLAEALLCLTSLSLATLRPSLKLLMPVLLSSHFLYKVMKSFICRGFSNPVTSKLTGRTSVDVSLGLSVPVQIWG